MSRLIRALALATLTLLVLLPPATAQALDTVSLRLDWVIGSEHAPIFLAREKGFFREEGIDVNLLAGEGSTVVVKLVGNKTNDFGYATADQVLMAHAKGLPIKTTAVVLQNTPACIIFPKDKPIRKLEELYGKRLGTQIKSVVDKQWEAVARINNIDRKKITEIPSDRVVAQAMTAGKLDAAVAFFFNDGLLLEAKGQPTGWLLFSDLGLRVYSTSLVVNEDTLKEKPDLVRRFTKAFVRGWTYSKEHQQEALDIFLKANPNIDPAYSKLKLPAVLGLTESEDTKKNGLGFSTKAGWEAMQKALLDMKLMEAPIDVTKVFTNEYLPKR
jgi:NitT/TauT family transport system substrate-binding protein